jgi:hypothetical protein
MKWRGRRRESRWEISDDQPLLGAVTLEILGLVLNPFNRQLQPMQAVLA